MAEALAMLMDRVAIQDVLFRYARGVDRRDWELVRGAFFQDATDHHGSFRGTRDEFIEWVSKSHATVAKSTHFLGNCLIEFAADDVAAVETYFYAVLRLGAEAESHRQVYVGVTGVDNALQIRLEVMGRYVDRFERRDSEWRIARRQVVFDSMDSQAASGDVDANPSWMLGRRDATDAVFLNRRSSGFPA